MTVSVACQAFNVKRPCGAELCRLGRCLLPAKPFSPQVMLACSHSYTSAGGRADAHRI